MSEPGFATSGILYHYSLWMMGTRLLVAKAVRTADQAPFGFDSRRR